MKLAHSHSNRCISLVYPFGLHAYEVSEILPPYDRLILMMQAEIQLLSPLVPVRQLSFLRLLVHHGHPLLLGSLVEEDIHIPESRFSMFNFQITWVEHSQYDESLIHQLYRPLIAKESNGNKDAMDLEICSRGNVVGKLVRTKHHKEIIFPLVINSSESNLSSSRRIHAHMADGC
ncbi:hypothetical protein AHAS_Ahas18G0236100 [Arachis hypogaea]